MIRLSAWPAWMISLLTVACAGNASRNEAPAARLSFAAEATVAGFPGGFKTLDARPIAGSPLSLELPPGRHTVGYVCPNHIVLDGPPTVTATFEPGKAYVLHCMANEPGRIEQR